MNKQLNIGNDEHKVIVQVKEIKGLYSRLVSFVMVVTALTLLKCVYGGGLLVGSLGNHGLGHRLGNSRG